MSTDRMPPKMTHLLDPKSAGVVLGFDARETWLPGSGGWDPKRRNAYLLRLDVTKPLSMDRNVWGSIFDLRPDLVPAYTGPLVGLWEDLGRLEAILATEKQAWRRVAFVLSTVSATAGERAALDRFLTGVDSDGAPVGRPETVIANPSVVHATWELLGYDVTDLTTSGLSNMGYLPGVDDTAALRTRWGPHLNDAHLFADRSQAEAFKDFSNGRVPEHAPFYVVGLWDIHKFHGEAVEDREG